MDKCFLLICAIVFCAQAEAQSLEQDSELDSLVALYNVTTDADSQKALLQKISLEHYSVDSTIKYSTLLLEACTDKGDENYKSDAYRFLSWSYYNKRDYITASDYAYKAIEASKAAGDKTLIALSYTTLADATSLLQDEVHADEYYHEALRLFKETGDLSHASNTLRNMAHSAITAHLWNEAREYALEALELDSASGNIGEYAFDIYYLAYMDKEYSNTLGDKRSNERDSLLAMSLVKYHKSYNIAAANNELAYLPYIARQMAESYLTQVKCNCDNKQMALDSAKWWIDEAMRIKEIDENDAEQTDISLSYISYLVLSNKTNEAADSIRSIRNFLMSSDEYRYFYEDFYTVLREFHTHNGDYQSALEAADSVTYWKYEFNAIDFAIKASHNAAMAKFYEREKAYETDQAMRGYVIGSLVVVLLLIVTVLILVIRNNLRRKRDNARLDEQNAILSRQEEELRVQNETLAERNDAILHAQQEVNDSLNYARLIQQATMPSDADVKAIFPNSMILFRPLNIVSGDFYWVGQEEHILMLAVADCTGHGVPGAVMSMLGLSLLNAAKCRVLENGVVSVARVLDSMRAALKEALHQKQDDNNSNHDGLDIAMVAFDTKTNTLHFAGAFRPLIICRKGEVSELKGDRMPIGVHVFESEHFTNHEFQLMSNDMIYLFTDGLVDQFGIAPSGESRKFTHKRLRELLARLSALPLEMQKREIAKTIDTWRAKGNTDFEQPQTDDTLIVGFRV